MGSGRSIDCKILYVCQSLNRKYIVYDDSSMMTRIFRKRLVVVNCKVPEPTTVVRTLNNCRLITTTV